MFWHPGKWSLLRIVFLPSTEPPLDTITSSGSLDAAIFTWNKTSFFSSSSSSCCSSSHPKLKCSPQSNSLDVMLPSGPFTRTKRAGFHPPRADNWKDQKSTARAKARQGTQGKVLLSTYFRKSFFCTKARGSSSSVLSPTPVGIRAGQAAPKSYSLHICNWNFPNSLFGQVQFGHDRMSDYLIHTFRVGIGITPKRWGVYSQNKAAFTLGVKHFF